MRTRSQNTASEAAIISMVTVRLNKKERLSMSESKLFSLPCFSVTEWEDDFSVLTLSQVWKSADAAKMTMTSRDCFQDNESLLSDDIAALKRILA